MERNRHLDEVTAHAWIDGALAAGEAEQVEAHVRGCERCAATVADARGVIAAASRIVGALDLGTVGVVPAARRRSGRGRSWWAVRVAACLVLVAGGTVFLARTRPEARPSAPAAAKREFMQARAAAAPVRAEAPVIRCGATADSAADSAAVKKCRRDSVPK
jgi:anti-sigma factor RsiW